MTSSLAKLTLVAAAICAAPAARAEGALRICRVPPRASGLHDRETVRIPAGTVFTNGLNKDGDDLKPFFEVATTDDAALPPKPGCVVAPVKFTRNPEHFTLTPAYPVELPSQFSMPGISIAGRVVRPVE